MGSYAECWLGNLYIGTTKDHFDYHLMQLFTAPDKRVERLAVRDLPRPSRWAAYFDDPNEKIDVVYYTAPVWTVKDRLELRGYTLGTAKRAFTKRMRFQAKEYSRPPAQLAKCYACRQEILKSVHVESWLDSLHHIKARGLGTETRRGLSLKHDLNLEDFMLEQEWYGFSGADLYVPIRLALEVCDQTDSFIYDLTDLVTGGEVEKREDCVAVSSEFAGSPKTIILTEGRSDGWILSQSMKLLYPHLYDCFSFMDFDAARVEGGASNLARIVKSFAGAGIVNRAIAIFDNDAVGQEAIHSLHQAKLPATLCILKLPDLDALRKYPTIGPSGRKTMDVNRSAASIELYLGDDVLRENGKLPPIHWASYSQSAGRYQGSLSDADKGKIQKRFKEKLARQTYDHGLVRDRNWLGLSAIMYSIFSAFHRLDQSAIA
ncbi:MAG TPA: HEPN/Toprim-associated domain-containing protein, partial [Candidatus Acidoferrales bacterium]|nr:HEPN/Toprim-associated domain-containing protein [Candidatus Acidoferrales bacterium]